MGDDEYLQNPFEENQMPVLKLLVKGKSVEDIALELGRPYETVNSQVKRMMVLAGACKNTELTYIAGKNRWA
jgi:DNA-binding NarL/FixJ family response regulator